MRSRVIWTGLLGVCLFAGCSRSTGPELHPVSGSVTFQGKPLATGRIVFVPERTQENSGPVLGSEITDGAYKALVTAGRKTVEIHASLPTGKMGVREDGSQYEEMVGLPERYNAASRLEVDIVAGKNEGVDFQLD